MALLGVDPCSYKHTHHCLCDCRVCDRANFRVSAIAKCLSVWTDRSLCRSDDASSNVHPTLATAVLALVVAQVVFGGLAKWLKPPSFGYVTLQAKRHPMRYVHIFLGLATAALLCALQDSLGLLVAV